MVSRFRRESGEGPGPVPGGLPAPFRGPPHVASESLRFRALFDWVLDRAVGRELYGGSTPPRQAHLSPVTPASPQFPVPKHDAPQPAPRLQMPDTQQSGVPGPD